MKLLFWWFPLIFILQWLFFQNPKIRINTNNICYFPSIFMNSFMHWLIRRLMYRCGNGIYFLFWYQLKTNYLFLSMSLRVLIWISRFQFHDINCRYNNCIGGCFFYYWIHSNRKTHDFVSNTGLVLIYYVWIIYFWVFDEKNTLSPE